MTNPHHQRQLPAPELSDAPLTSRETQVLALIARGKTMKEIAHALRMSFSTAATHRYHIQQKLNPHHTADLTRAAVRMGLIEP
jgi:two-component system, NarL family, response regulator NreC